MSDKLRLFTTFSGYDSQAMALDTTWLDYDFIGYSEIKPMAIKAHERLFPGVPNFGDICKIDWASVPDFDIFTYSFPCQDLSLMGKRKGMSKDSGTHSSLLWECAKAIEAKRPRYLVSENVPQCVNADLVPWLSFLTEHGYVTTVITSDAYDHGSLQHRKRTFFLSRPEAMGKAKDEQPISELGGWHKEEPTEDGWYLIKSDDYSNIYERFVAEWDNQAKHFYEESTGMQVSYREWKLIEKRKCE